MSNMAATFGGCTVNGSIHSINGGCYNKETKMRQSSTPVTNNLFIKPVVTTTNNVSTKSFMNKLNRN